MNRIEALRKKQGWRQADLAERLHVKPQSVSHYEKGDRGLDVETIHKICDLFGVSADYLLCRSDLPGLDLAPDEQELVRRWRQLAPDGRAFLLQSLTMLEITQAQKNIAVPDVEAAT